MSGAGGIPDVIELDIRAEKQQTQLWCWAGCICGIARFCKADQQPTEGELVNLALGRTDCTHDPVPVACIVPAPAVEPVALLARLGVSCVAAARPLPPSELLEELAAGRPVMVGLAFREGGGHYVIVRGYRKWTDQFVVSDPWFGDADVPYPFLATAYGRGEWALTYGRFEKGPS